MSGPTYRIDVPDDDPPLQIIKAIHNKLSEIEGIKGATFFPPKGIRRPHRPLWAEDVISAHYHSVFSGEIEFRDTITILYQENSVSLNGYPSPIRYADPKLMVSLKYAVKEAVRPKFNYNQ